MMRYKKLAQRSRKGIAKPLGGYVEWIAEVRGAGLTDLHIPFCGKRTLQKFLDGLAISDDAAPPRKLVELPAEPATRGTLAKCTNSTGTISNC